MTPHDQRTAFLAANSAAFRELVSLLWELGGAARAQEALAIAERGRARALLDVLHAARLPDAGISVPLDLSAVRARLGPRDLLIEFVDAGPELFAFRLSSEGLAWQRLPVDEHLGERIRFFRGLLQQDDDGRAAQTTAARLYDQLLAPLLAHGPEGVDRLLLVPDGVLGHLPFEALRAGAGAPGERAYLGQRFVTAYLPSASLVKGRQTGSAAPAPLLAVADPPTGTAGSGDGYRRSLSRTPVPGAALEAASAARSVGGAEVMSGPAVTEAAVKRAGLERYRLLHFATHAVVDEVVPLRSGLWLGDGAGEDGWLEAREIYGMHLDPDLTVLSACDTGYGRVAGGEGAGSSRSSCSSQPPPRQ